MLLDAPIPHHITCLYVYTVISLLLHVSLVSSDVSINDYKNRTFEIFRDLPADFGPGLTRQGLRGYLVRIEEINACRLDGVNPPPTTPHNNSYKWIALVARGQCDFSLKVLNAQRQGYDAVIVRNNDSDALIHMGGDRRGHEVHIPSVFIGRNDGLYIGREYSYIPGIEFTVTLDNEGPLDMNYYLVPFAAVVGCCFLLMLVFMVGKWMRDYRTRNKSRVSKKHLKTIPIKKYKKGEDFDLCAICLEDYEEGDKLRELPCLHMYHCKCIDQWLTKSRGTCPVCKRKVFPNLRTESDTDSEDDDEDERRPLLGTGPSTSSHGAIQQSGLPAVNPIAEDTSSEQSAAHILVDIDPEPTTPVKGPPAGQPAGHIEGYVRMPPPPSPEPHTSIQQVDECRNQAAAAEQNSDASSNLADHDTTTARAARSTSPDTSSEGGPDAGMTLSVTADVTSRVDGDNISSGHDATDVQSSPVAEDQTQHVSDTDTHVSPLNNPQSTHPNDSNIHVSSNVPDVSYDPDTHVSLGTEVHVGQSINSDVPTDNAGNRQSDVIV